MLIKVYRYDPESCQTPFFQEFEVPAQSDWSVMDILD